MLELVEKDTTNYLGIPSEQIPEITGRGIPRRITLKAASNY